MGKIIDIMRDYMKEGKPLFSFEFFPPKTDDGVENLFERMDRMVSYRPTFCDITWGAGGSTAELTLDIADRMQNEINVECMMHLTCTNMPEAKLKEAMAFLKKSGVRNILALRGDPPHGQEKFEAVDGGFSCALDLIRYIRKETGDHFGIGVSGYPEAHPDVIVADDAQMEKNYWADIHYLKEKLDAGADFVITQLFYDVDTFIRWVKDCRSVGITAPILPGIMPIMAYGGFNRMTAFCKTFVPQEIKDKIEELKDDEAGLKEYGIDLGVQICKKILDAGVSPGLHMYSLNQDKSAVAIIERLGLLDTAAVPRELPFRARTRLPEGVRPVYWQNRSKSYLERTADWEALPVHRWAEAGSTPFAEASTRVLTQTVCTDKRKEAAVAAWGNPESLESIKTTFSSVHASGGMFPWADAKLPGTPAELLPQVQAAIKAGALPIHVLPAVNGAPSTDVSSGWGQPGGYVYQKQYLEFFCSADAFKALAARAQTLPSITYMAATGSGEFFSNSTATSAVAWGCFPGAEVVQPLVVAEAPFKAWHAEASALWTSAWGAAVGDGPGVELLADIRKNWVLVAALENDFVGGDVFRLVA